MIGADPEIIPVDSNNNPHSVIGKLPGNKKNPFIIKDGAIQVDNVNAEFNILPCNTFEQFNSRMKNVMSVLAEEMRKSQLYISTMASAMFPQEELVGDALIAGCDPDFEAWGISDNIPPNVLTTRLRSAGGHVHVSNIPGLSGYSSSDNYHFIVREDEDPMLGIFLVRALDYRLGVQSVLRDKDTERKKLYGKAGCFRPKPYGIEYRTLSNFWIFQEEDRRWLWDEVTECLKFFDVWKLEDDSLLGQDIQKAINNNDKALAESIVRNYA